MHVYKFISPITDEEKDNDGILTKEMIAASSRIFTKRSSNCSSINSQSGFPAKVHKQEFLIDTFTFNK